MRRVKSIAVAVAIAGMAVLCLAEPALASGRPSGSGPVEEDGNETAAGLQPRPGCSWYVGARAGFYAAQGQPFIGGEVLVPVASRVSFNPNVEWVFVEEIDGIFTANADMIYDFPLSAGNFMWAGAGVGVRHFAKGGGWAPENNLALNLLGGLGFGQGKEYMPFVQGKLSISDATEFVLSAGFRF